MQCRVERLGFLLKDYRVGKLPQVYIVKSRDEVEQPWDLNQWLTAGSSAFNGSLTCCTLGHKLPGTGTPIRCDKEHFVPIFQMLHANACTRLRAGRAMNTWRKVLAIEWSLYAGADGFYDPPPPVTTAQHFLDKYEIPDVNAFVEGGMTALHYAAYENCPSAVRASSVARAERGCSREESACSLPALVDTCARRPEPGEGAA